MLKTEKVDRRTRRSEPTLESPVAHFIYRRVEELGARGKNQREIAEAMGYEKPNMLSMMKHGDAKVPLDKVPAFAKALECDAGHLFRLALMQYWPEVGDAIQQIFGNTVSNNEMKFVRKLREISANADPELTTALATAMTDHLAPLLGGRPSVQQVQAREPELVALADKAHTK